MSLPPTPAIRLPSGVRDFLPRAAARRRAIAGRLIEEFEAWGYARIITPVFECADVLERGLGADARAAAIRFVEPGTGDIVALRPDITPQIARVAATRMHDTGGPLRLCYEGAVTRMAGARGQREILQAGVELIDAPSPAGDAEVLSLAAAALATIGVHEVRLDVGHVALARWVLDAVPAGEQREHLEESLGKKDRAGVVRAARGLEPRLCRVLEALPTLFGEPDEVLAAALALPVPAEVGKVLRSVEKVLQASRELGLGESHAGITMDLGEIRGFDYYTGLRFAGYAAGVGEAVLRGGRYDELVGRYGRDARATGFAVDVEAIAQAQASAGVAAPAWDDAVLVVASAARRSEAARLAATLRARGVRAAMDLAPRQSRAALRDYAAGVGFTRLLVLTDDASQIESIDETEASIGHGSAVPARALAQARAGRADELLRALGFAPARRARRA